MSDTFSGRMAFFILLITFIALAVPLLCGVMLLFQSKRGGKGHPSCGDCGYDVSATLAAGNLICPECGQHVASVGVMPAASRVDRRMMFLGILLIASPALTCGNIAIFLPVYNAYLRAPQRPIIVQQPAPPPPPTAPLSQSSAQPDAPPSSQLPPPEALGEQQP